MPPEEIKLTSQQAQAIGLRGASIALSAGAGCGKTFVLTQRFLADLGPQAAADTASGDPLSGIVAITFTDRAAREMRDRIRSACQKMLSQCPPEETAHWLKVTRGLDSARISTIHSFCGSLLRAHAVEGGIDPGFGLLETASGDTFLRQTVSKTLFELLEARDDDAMPLVLEFGLQGTCDLLGSLMKGRFRVEPGRFDGMTDETLAAEWEQCRRERILPALWTELIESYPTKQLSELLKDNEPSHELMSKRRTLLLDGLGPLPESNDPLQLSLHLSGLREAAKIQGGGGKKVWNSPDIYEDVKEGLTDLRKSIDKMLKFTDVDPSDLQTAARFSLMALRVTQKLGERFDSEKMERGLLDFDDLLLRTRDLLRTSESVRARVASSIDTLMVDEFQDTDPVQTEIVRHLCGGDLCSGKLFLVGDAKQSIYRFRRADPRVFARLRNELPEQGRLPLSVNFRSVPEILNFVNCLFAPEMGDDYEPLRPHVETQKLQTPAVEFLFATDLDSDEKENVEQRRRREADWIARRIVGLLNDNTPRIRFRKSAEEKVELRTTQAGDVTILFRTLSNIAIYEDALKKHQLPYYLVGGRAFFAQQEVFDLTNLCRFLDDRDDQVALTGVLRSPFFSLNDDTLFAMVDASGSLLDALAAPPPPGLSASQKRQVEYAAQILDELHRNKDRLPLAVLLNRAVERTGYDASLLNEFLGHRKLANLQKMIELARRFDRSGLGTLKDFVQQMHESIVEETHEELAATHSESSNVVRLMTVHQAKGLEFPVVIVADMEWAGRGGRSSAYFHPEFGPLLPLPPKHGVSRDNPGLKMHQILEKPEEAAESTRLLYVATTRAADHLILSAGLESDGKPTSEWLKLLARRFDLQTGLPAGDPYLGRTALGEVDRDAIPEIRVHHEAPGSSSDSPASNRPQVPLSHFRKQVEQAQPADVPQTVSPVAPDRSSRRRFSVSEIEEASKQGLAVTTPVRTRETSPPANRPTKADRLDSTALDSTALGTLVHVALEHIDFRNPEQLDTLVGRCTGRLDRGATDELKSTASGLLETFLSSAVSIELSRATQCFRELDFLLRRSLDSQPSETITIAGQIDCLYQSPDGGWHIIDYKTGSMHIGDPQAVIAKYDLQLAIYALAVQELLGRLPDSLELVMLHENVVRIPVLLTDDFLASARLRIDEAIRALRS